VTIPAGKLVRGYTQNGTVFIQGTNLVSSLFVLSSFSSVQNIALSVSGGGSCITTSGTTGIKISDVSFAIPTAVLATEACLRLTNCVDGMIEYNSFSGVRGFISTGSTRMRFQNNRFDNSFSLTTGTNDHVEGNIFTNTPAPIIGGQNLIVVNNHFLGPLPSKLLTNGSLWLAYWPAPMANNDAGIDTFTLSLGDFGLYPVVVGATVAQFQGTGVIAFADAINGVASSLPILLPGRVDRLQGFSALLSWTSPASTSGDVSWQVTATFRDAVSGVIGTSVVHGVITTRSSLIPIDETTSSFTFTNLEYGLPGGVVPTHATLLIRRVGLAPGDTLSATAYLLSASLTLPRD